MGPPSTREGTCDEDIGKMSGEAKSGKGFEEKTLRRRVSI